MIDVLMIMPCYNAEATILDAIKSVSFQHYKNFKLVCIDDCSTDKTLQVLNKYKSQYKYDVITSEHNQGTGTAINTAISKYNLKNFKYVTWVSADNILAPHFLNKMIKKLQETNSNICYGAWESWVYNPKPVLKRGPLLTRRNKIHNPDPDISILKTQYKLGPAFLFSTEVWEKAGPYHNLPGEDYVFAVKAAKQECKFCFVFDTPLVKYRIHNNSVSGRMREGTITQTATPYAKELAQQS